MWPKQEKQLWIAQNAKSYEFCFFLLLQLVSLLTVSIKMIRLIEIESGLIFSFIFPPLPHYNANVCGTTESRYDVLHFVITWWFSCKLRIDQTTFEYYSWKWTRKCSHRQMFPMLVHILIVHCNFLNYFDKDHMTNQKKSDTM